MKGKQRTLTLTDAERADLVRERDHDPRPYLRERAAALLKIADGQSAHLVARMGLLKPRTPDTVYRWLDRYEQDRQITPRPACRVSFSPLRPRTRGVAPAVARACSR